MNHPDTQFDAAVLAMQAQLNKMVETGTVLFQVDSTDLFHHYLLAFPYRQRQHFNCHTCSDFIRHFGGLVTVDGATIWDAKVDGVYKSVFRSLAVLVKQRPIIRPFFSDTGKLGIPCCGGWTHFTLRLPNGYTAIHKGKATAAILAKCSDYVLAQTLLGTYKLPHVEKVYDTLCMLEGARSDHLRDLEVLLGLLKQTPRELWRYVALNGSPTTFHLRAGVLGAVLQLDRPTVEQIKDVYLRLVDPTRYMRPQAPPAEGTIHKAEVIFQELGLESALVRRFATVDELPALWRASGLPQPKAGVFQHLRRDGQDRHPVTLRGGITWTKFQRDVLPHVRSMQVEVPRRTSNMVTFSTAVDPEAQPLFRWGNNIGWYVYTRGVLPSLYDLEPGKFTDVLAIAELPNGEGVAVIPKGCRDTIHQNGTGIFAEALRYELHGVRSVMEAHSQQDHLRTAPAGKELACGILLQKNPWIYGVTIVAKLAHETIRYDIDRWD